MAEKDLIPTANDVEKKTQKKKRPSREMIMQAALAAKRAGLAPEGGAADG